MFRKMMASVLLGTAILILAGCSSVQPVTEGTYEAAAPEAKRGVVKGILLYLPNRLVDVTDIVSLHVGIPRLPHLVAAHPLHVNAHVTRVMQAGFGISKDTLCLGKQYGRQFSPWLQSFEEISLGPATLCSLSPTSGNRALEFAKAGMLSPMDLPFSGNLMDFWSVGAQATVISASAGAEMHPIEVADLLLGFFLIDVRDDDF